MPLHVMLAQRCASAPQPERSVERSIILEAEVVPFNEGQREGGRGPGVEEFWWLGEAGVSTQGPGR
jgi:DNA ligase-4